MNEVCAVCLQLHKRMKEKLSMLGRVWSSETHFSNLTSKYKKEQIIQCRHVHLSHWFTYFSVSGE